MNKTDTNYNPGKKKFVQQPVKNLEKSQEVFSKSGTHFLNQSSANPERIAIKAVSKKPAKAQTRPSSNHKKQDSMINDHSAQYLRYEHNNTTQSKKAGDRKLKTGTGNQR